MKSEMRVLKEPCGNKIQIFDGGLFFIKGCDVDRESYDYLG